MLEDDIVKIDENSVGQTTTEQPDKDFYARILGIKRRRDDETRQGVDGTGAWFGGDTEPLEDGERNKLLLLPPKEDEGDYDSVLTALQSTQIAAATARKDVITACAEVKGIEYLRCPPTDTKEIAKRAHVAKTIADKLKPLDEARSTLLQLERCASTTARSDAFGMKDKGATAATRCDWDALWQDAARERTALDIARPDWFDGSDTNWIAALSKRLATFTETDPQLRQNALDSAKTDGKIAAKDSGTAIQQVLGKYQVRDQRRAAMFFDAGRNGVAISPEDQAVLQRENEKLAQAGIAVLDNGGGWAEVKEVMRDSGLTEEFWPPQLVQAVQAWRKTTRALQQERVGHIVDATNNPDKVSPTVDDVSNIVGFIGSFTDLDDSVRDLNKDKLGLPEDDTSGVAGLVAATGDKAKMLEEVSKWLGTATTGLGGAKSLFDMLKNSKQLIETLKSGDKTAVEKVEETLTKGFEALTNALATGKSGMDIASSVSEPIQQHLKKMIPFIGIAIAGAEFATAIKELYEKGKLLSKTAGLKKEGLALFIADDGDEALVNSLGQAVSSERTKVAKQSVDVVGKGLELGGSLAKDLGGHVGATASAALTMTATGITLGSKVVFAGINWGQVRKARQTFLEARQGNMQAQVEIFENSALYAKMYLAILVQEENPLAKKYIVDRGIEEGDLESATGLQILRDAMLLDAEQQDDLTEQESAPKRELREFKEDVSSVVNEMRQQLVTETYDPNAPQGVLALTEPAEWSGEWAARKTDLVAAGLINDASGLTVALKSAGTWAADAEKDYRGWQANADDETTKKALATLQATIKAMGGAVLKAYKFNAQAYDPAVQVGKRIAHTKGMADLEIVRRTLNARVETCWTRYYEINGVDTLQWKPTPATLAYGDTAKNEWTQFWDSGVKSAGFGRGGAAAAEQIAKALEAGTAYQSATDGREKREAAVYYVHRLDRINDSLEDALDDAGLNRFASAIKVVSEFMASLNVERQRIDLFLAGEGDLDDQTAPKWAIPTAGVERYSADLASNWAGIWKAAVEGGFTIGGDEGGTVFNKDAGFAAALKTAVEKLTQFASAAAAQPPKPKAMVDAFFAAQAGAGAAKKAGLQFERLHRYSAEALKVACRMAVQSLVGEVSRLQPGVSQGMQQAPVQRGAKKLDGNSQPILLSSRNGRETLDNAVSSGAMREDKYARQELAEIIKALKKAATEYDAMFDNGTLKKSWRGDDKLKEVRKKAIAYEKAREEAMETAKALLAQPPLTINPQLKTYLTELRDAFTNHDANRKPAYKDFAQGKHQLQAAAFVPPQTPALDDAEWSKTKNAAVKSGVVSDAASGVTAAMKDYAAEAKKNTTPNPHTEKLRTLLEKAKKGSGLAKWTDYVQALIDLVK